MSAIQVLDELRQIHLRIVEFVGNEGVAKALEAGAGLLVVLFFLFYLRSNVSPGARRRRAARKRFQRLVRAHRLPSNDRQLLMTMARKLELDEPAMIFVRRSLFESAADEGGFNPERLDMLRRELYS
ncbi:MAG TPA: hypothetical protein VK661_12535 [Planctomycetota bacterium]|nr:hypothetical protein [Planctomycetota bacterium]